MTVTDFPGLDRRETARIGGFREMRNLCGEGYPTLRTRQARGLIAMVTKARRPDGEGCPDLGGRHADLRKR